MRPYLAWTVKVQYGSRLVPSQPVSHYDIDEALRIARKRNKFRTVYVEHDTPCTVVAAPISPEERRLYT